MIYYRKPIISNATHVNTIPQIVAMLYLRYNPDTLALTIYKMEQTSIVLDTSTSIDAIGLLIKFYNEKQWFVADDDTQFNEIERRFKELKLRT